MMSIKEAVWAREKSGGRMRTTVFHMDIRTPGKGWQAYKERAEQVHGVRFERARIHSIDTAPGSGDPVLRYVGLGGTVTAETVDLVVLAVGQRPAAAAAHLAEVTGIQRDDRGFFLADPLLPARTEREGVFLGGTAGGFRPISGSVIQASAAALEAARTVHKAGGSLATVPESGETSQPLLREPWRIRVAVCTCGRHGPSDDFRADEFQDKISRAFQQDPAVADVFFVERACLPSGLEEIKAQAGDANGLVVGACRHHQWKQNRNHVAATADLPPFLVEWVDLYPAGTGAAEPSVDSIAPMLEMGLAHLKHSAEDTGAAVAVTPKALVAGGGIAGMQAALGIADMGYHVDLVERDDDLGGNLRWIHSILGSTLGGQEVAPFLDNIRSRVKEHPQIDVHFNASIRSAGGTAGDFISMVETRGGDLAPIRHGAVVLATGGREAAVKEYGWGTHDSIITQKEFEQQYKEKHVSEEGLNSVVMIQCVGSREAERPYCSRVCCATALKHALALKQQNPDVRIWILYRDLMADGFNEAYYTRARRAGVIFIPYKVNRKPVVKASKDEGVRVQVVDPVLETTLEIEADLLVLATGVVSELPRDLAAAYGAEVDSDGFFREADAKWRPVQALADGVLACGLSQGPVTIAESVASGQAAAMAALRVLTRSELKAGKPTASVIHRLCSLCEQCLAFCPYGARRIDDESGHLEVHPGLCQGCGACTVACPSGAATLNGQSAAQLLSVIHGALGRVCR
jgi:heterodisulfide reductase subunit A